MVLVEYMKDHELEEFPFYSAYFFSQWVNMERQ